MHPSNGFTGILIGKLIDGNVTFSLEKCISDAAAPP